MKGLVRQVIVLIAVFAMVYLNLTSNASGFTEPEQVTIEQYYLYPTDFSPTPLTFLIWAPIFLGMIVFAIYQALPKNRRDERFDEIALPVVLVSVLNGVINYVPIGISVINVFLLLIALTWTFIKIVRLPSDRLFYLTTRVPVGLFFGWITIASILNVCQWLVSVGWNGSGIPSTIWVAILIVIASAVGAFIIMRFKEIAYGAVLLWGFGGILVSNPSQVSVILAVITCSILLIILGVQTIRHQNALQDFTAPA
ncbi:MAG: hypothetical protein AAF846_13865 [Chloroflexota bacterium]